MPGGARTLTPVFDAPARRAAYRSLVITGLDPAAIKQIRATLQRHALGNDPFRQAVERQLGRRVGPGRGGSAAETEKLRRKGTLTGLLRNVHFGPDFTDPGFQPSERNRTGGGASGGCTW